MTEDITLLQKRIRRQRQSLGQLNLRNRYLNRLLAAIIVGNTNVFHEFKPGEDNPRLIDEVLYIDALVESERRASVAERALSNYKKEVCDARDEPPRKD